MYVSLNFNDGLFFIFEYDPFLFENDRNIFSFFDLYTFLLYDSLTIRTGHIWYILFSIGSMTIPIASKSQNTKPFSIEN